MFVQVFLVKKITMPDAGQLYAMKVLKKATLKGVCFVCGLMSLLLNMYTLKQFIKLLFIMFVYIWVCVWFQYEIECVQRWRETS